MFMSNYGVSLLALGAVFIFAAETRFAIMKRNFINSLALQNYLKLLEKQKHVIERKNEDITASINYAQKIQKNILPRPEEIEEYIEEYFILFKPRDIVSGDFYWFTHIPNSLTSNHEVLLWVVADCTGHGVPGALMSMLGNELLNEIVFHQHITSPEDILTLLHEGIFKTLKQKEGNSQDGMDISVLLIDKIDKTVEFAGAKHTLIFTKNGDFFEVKGDKFSIGGSLRGDKPCFTCNKIHLEQDTEYIFYMFSDGYQDQFGGPQNKKFLSKNFKKLLHKNHSLDMNVQKQILDDTLEEWRVLGQQAQIDDILVTGIKLKV
jgi:serine phosphatase RsbU (regulator of sigma subunit)